IFLEQGATHSAQLKEKDEEIARLSAEVEALKLSQKSELEKVDQEFSEEKNRLVLELQKNKELFEAAELKTRGMSEEIARFEKNKIDWAKDLQLMMSYIHRKHLNTAGLFFFLLLPSDASLFCAGHFPEAKPVSSKAVLAARARRGLPVDVNFEYSIEDFLVSVGAALGPMKIMGRDLVLAAIRAHRALWPNTSGTPNISEIELLVTRLNASEKQLSLWRESAGRAGADMALTVIMSWYEDISLDILRNFRTGSRWVEDPTFVALRQARAFQLVEYADVHTWNEGPSFLPNPDEEVVVEDASDDSAEQGGDEDDSATSGDSSSSSDDNGDARSSSKGTGNSTAQIDAPQQPQASAEVAPRSAEGEVTSAEVPPTSESPAPDQVAVSPVKNV
ncbi:MAG: TMF family protein, partial [Bifidobacteriaceae bacterium]|nr:TMF family protein [Bifidobacteriaceae bacterium]